MFKIKCRCQVILLTLTILSIFIFSNTLLAFDNIFQDIAFDRQTWIRSSDEVIIYSIEFHEINQRYFNTLGLSAYISASSSSNMGLEYNKVDSQIKLFSEDSKDIALKTANYLIDEERRIQSYLMTLENKTTEIVLREKYLKQPSSGEKDLLFDLSLKPLMIDYDGKRILTDIKFKQNSEENINTLETSVWVRDDHDEAIAIVNKRSFRSGEEKNRFFLIYLSAVVVSNEEINDVNKITRIADVSDIAEIFTKDFLYSDAERRIKGEFAFNKVSFEYSYDKIYVDYTLHLSKYFSKPGLIYTFNGGIELYPGEGLSIRTIISNGDLLNNINQEGKQSYSPNIRFGIADTLTWRDRYQLAISYYPIAIRTATKIDRNLFRFYLAYQENTWKATYNIDFIRGKNQQRFSLAYIFNENKNISLNYNIGFSNENSLSIAFEVPFG
ncbi:hypothetical protein [Natronospora cellulosivora (SeqCode)]